VSHHTAFKLIKSVDELLIFKFTSLHWIIDPSPSENKHTQHVSYIFKECNAILQMNVGKGKAHHRRGHEGPRDIRGIAVPFKLGTKCRGMVNTSCFNPRKDPVPIVQDAGWAPEPVWMGAVVYENISEHSSVAYLSNVFARTKYRCQRVISCKILGSKT
jgi:hypothetical protein